MDPPQPVVFCWWLLFFGNPLRTAVRGGLVIWEGETCVFRRRLPAGNQREMISLRCLFLSICFEVTLRHLKEHIVKKSKLGLTYEDQLGQRKPRAGKT